MTSIRCQPVTDAERVIGRTVRYNDYEVHAVLACPDRPWDRHLGIYRDRRKAEAAIRHARA